MGFKPRIEKWNDHWLVVDASFEVPVELERFKRRIEADIALHKYMQLAQCHGKEAFSSQHKADCKRGKYEKDFDVSYRSYQCELCSYWHLTTSLKRKVLS